MTSPNDHERDAVLDEFIMEPRHDRETFDRYLRRHPDHAAALIDLAHEIELQSLASDPDRPDDEAWISSSVSSLLAAFEPPSDPFAGVTKEDIRRIRDELGWKTSVLTAFRDRLVNPATVPGRWLTRLAQALNAGAKDLLTYLALPPQVAADAQFRSDQAPAAQAKISFDAVLEQAGYDPSERSQMLLDGD